MTISVIEYKILCTTAVVFFIELSHACMYDHHVSLCRVFDQPGRVANPARGQLNREMSIPLSPHVAENLVSRDRFSRPVPRQPAHPYAG